MILKLIQNVFRLIAIMLGRLEMTVDQCIEAYTGMMDVIFDPKDKKKLPFKLSNGKVQPKYKTKHMEQAIKQVIINAKWNPDGPFRGSKNSACKTYVDQKRWCVYKLADHK